MKGYAFILNGKVVINPEEKPHQMNYEGNVNAWLLNHEEWESNCIEVENVWYCHLNKYWCINDEYPKYRQEIIPGSQVEHDGPVITRIL